MSYVKFAEIPEFSQKLMVAKRPWKKIPLAQLLENGMNTINVPIPLAVFFQIPDESRREFNREHSL